MAQNIVTDRIDLLYKALLELNKIPKTVNKPDWNYYDILEIARKDLAKVASKKSVWSSYVIIFDSNKVGYGEFGKSHQTEIKMEKWKNAFGLIQFKNTEGYKKISVSFSVIPKNIFYTKKTVLPYLLNYQKCSQCKDMNRHVKISNYDGTVLCIQCYDILKLSDLQYSNTDYI